jgi:cell division protease FtsH
LEEAIERVVMGPERKSRLISDEEKRIIAYHEAGHAVVANAIAEADPVQKVTIVGRGQAGGVTWFRPDEDRILMSRKKMLATLAYALGGRVAEELSSTTLPPALPMTSSRSPAWRAMVTRLGMSPRNGHNGIRSEGRMIFLGREISEQRDYSEAVAEQIDREVRKMVEDAYKLPRLLVKKYRKQLDAVAQKLLEVESLTREEFEALPAARSRKKSGTPQVKLV